MSFCATETLPVLDGMFFKRLGGAIGYKNEIPEEANPEIQR